MLPSWLGEPEEYTARRDSDAFIDRSARSFLRVLSRLHAPRRPSETGTGDAAVKLPSVFLLVLLLGLARSSLFAALAGTLLLVLLALQKAEVIARVLQTSLPAAAFSFLVLLPAALWGNLRITLLITAKVFLSVSAVRLFSATTDWASVSRALARLKVSGLFILVLDVTVRYIGLLGRLSVGLLEALKLRSVGRNADKTASLSGIGGALFLRSRQAAEELAAAMECRCFTGRYGGGARLPLSTAAVLLIAADCLLLAGFFLLTGHS